MNSSRIIISLSVFIACAIMVYIADRGVSDRVIPSLAEYISSSTPVVSSSTPSIASTTAGYQLFRAPQGVFRVRVARTPSTRERGLGGRDSLEADEGLLFIFPEQGRHGFWMKDMEFPIDIVWVRSDRIVVGISENISPDSYPEMFYPPSNIQFVLEIPAGSARTSGIKKGSAVDF